MQCKFVAYYRVSTVRQRQSGLGLAAQKAAVDQFAAERGCKIVGAYIETETGTKRATDNRPELQKALAHAKRAKATLVIAKLDRLARNVAFVANLLESAVDFTACDFPEANRLTIHIMSAVAEHESRMIAERTKAALAAAKRRGTLLGGANPACRNLTDAARRKGVRSAAKAVSALADEAYADLLPIVTDLRQQGLSLRDIATRLNDDGQTTRRGSEWTATQVARVLARA